MPLFKRQVDPAFGQGFFHRGDEPALRADHARFFNTPPMAMAACYLKGVAPPQVRLTQMFGGSLPFVFMVFITMGLLYAYPQLALWLPEQLYSR